jgi:hypothetical protein
VSDDDRRADVLRQFEAIIGGAGLDDLRQLAGTLSRLGAQAREPTPPRRPELRRPRLTELQRFVVRVDLRYAKPPIWRRLEIRSDLTLDVVHRVLQAAFGWTDSHLWRFSLGGDPFSPSSQTFLCQWDIEEGEVDDEGGIPAATVRMDEALQTPGDVLCYVYDYGALRCLRQYVRCDVYSPSRRNSSPTSPGRVHASASARIRALYSAVNERRLACSTNSGSATPSGAARPPAPNPSPATPRWSSRPAAAASTAAPAPFVLVSCMSGVLRSRPQGH